MLLTNNKVFIINDKKKYLLKTISRFFLFLIFLAVLVLSVRGLVGNPTALQLNDPSRNKGGPFELSPERGRFALLYSLVEDNSFYFSTDLARFTVPDLGYKNGHYVSLFAPAVSFIVAPGYVIGKLLGASQVGAYGIIAIFALLNLILIKKIANLLGANEISGWLSGFIFIFATPAFAYAVNLYQHHISTFLILLASYIVIKARKIWPLFFVWFLCAMSISVDYPNLFLMLPIGIYALLKIINVKKEDFKLTLNIKLLGFLTFLGVILPLVFFGWFNYKSYGNPLQLSGTVGSVAEIDSLGNPTARKSVSPEKISEFLNPDEQQKSALRFFKTRNMLNGLYIHILSPDRGIMIFTPIVLFGFFGMYVLYRKRNEFFIMFLAIATINLLLYSMWGDPWGGWAFGSRYLIPAYSIMAIFIGVALTHFRKSWLFLIPFYLLLVYSLGVNTLGALTTSAIPPQVEVLALEKLSGNRERYSYDRNWEFLNAGNSKSFVFQTFGNNYINSVQYYYFISGILILTASGMIIFLRRQR